jgi:opacity protein-like surface antigen
MRKSFLLLLSSALLSYQASAQWAEGFLEDGPHIGVATAGDVVDDPFVVGWQVEANVHELLTLEVAFTHFEDELSPDFFSSLGVTDGRADLTVNALTFTARINLLEDEHLRLYLGGGLGYYPVSTDIKDAENAIDNNAANSSLRNLDVHVSHDINYHAVAGVELFLSEHWELGFEARFTNLENDVDLTIAQDSGQGFLVTEEQDGSLDYDYLMLRVALNYRF